MSTDYTLRVAPPQQGEFRQRVAQPPQSSLPTAHIEVPGSSPRPPAVAPAVGICIVRICCSPAEPDLVTFASIIIETKPALLDHVSRNAPKSVRFRFGTVPAR